MHDSYSKFLKALTRSAAQGRELVLGAPRLLGKSPGLRGDNTLPAVYLSAPPATAIVSDAHDDMAFLSEVGQLFQACRTIEEVCNVARNRFRNLSPRLSGALYLMNDGAEYLENAMTWGRMGTPGDLFAPSDCWALRCGRPHLVGRGDDAITCSHVKAHRGDRHLCLPLMAQGEALGILYFRADVVRGTRSRSQHLFTSERLHFYHSISESLSLAIANVRLRESLRSQAIRDPLTGLFNRRYFEETLRRELHRAGRDGKPLSIVLLDIDHFKRLNDGFGHDAGDAALKVVGEILGRRTRAGDIACRYGGEEFALVFPGMPADVASARVENLRAQIECEDIYFHGRALDQVTVSAGIAVYPDHGIDMDSLVHGADGALYKSKEAGRNRVTMAHLSRRRTDSPTAVTLVHDADAAPDIFAWREK